MAGLRAISERWGRFYAAAKRELLRDPNVTLFNRGPDGTDRLHEEKLGLR